MVFRPSADSSTIRNDLSFIDVVAAIVSMISKRSTKPYEDTACVKREEIPFYNGHGRISVKRHSRRVPTTLPFAIRVRMYRWLFRRVTHEYTVRRTNACSSSRYFLFQEIVFLLYSVLQISVKQFIDNRGNRNSGEKRKKNGNLE